MCIIMESIAQTNNKYIKTDNNRFINEKHIRWIEQIGDCFEVCVKSTGCNVKNADTHRICKSYNPDSYIQMIRKIE